MIAVVEEVGGLSVRNGQASSGCRRSKQTTVEGPLCCNGESAEAVGVQI